MSRGSGLYILAVKGDLEQALFKLLKKNKKILEDFCKRWEEEDTMDEFTPENIVESLLESAKLFPINPLEDEVIASEIESYKIYKKEIIEEKEEEIGEQELQLIINQTEQKITKIKEDFPDLINSLRKRGFTVHSVRLDQYEYPTYLIEPLFIEDMNSTENPDFYFDFEFGFLGEY